MWWWTYRMSLTGTWFWKNQSEDTFWSYTNNICPLTVFRGGKGYFGLGAPLLSWLSVRCHLALAGGRLFSQATMIFQGVQAFLPSIQESWRHSGSMTILGHYEYLGLSTWNRLIDYGGELERFSEQRCGYWKLDNLWVLGWLWMMGRLKGQFDAGLAFLQLQGTIRRPGFSASL